MWCGFGFEVGATYLDHILCVLKMASSSSSSEEEEQEEKAVDSEEELEIAELAELAAMSSSVDRMFVCLLHSRIKF